MYVILPYCYYIVVMYAYVYCPITYSRIPRLRVVNTLLRRILEIFFRYFTVALNQYNKMKPNNAYHPSKPMRLGAALLLTLGCTAHLTANLVFQNELASDWIGKIPHLCLGLLAVGGAVLGTHIMVWFGRAGSAAGVCMSLGILGISVASTAISATGFYASEERRKSARTESRSRNDGLSDAHITSLREQIAALQGTGGGEGASPRIVQLQSQRAELVTQRDAFRKEGVITKGVNVVQPKIDSIDSQIASEQASQQASQGVAAKANSDRLEALQAEHSAAIAGAKQETKEGTEEVNAADALFQSLGKSWNVDPEIVRAKFFVYQPWALEALTLLLSFTSALLTPPSRRREDEPESYQPQPDLRQSPATRPRDIRTAATAESRPPETVEVPSPPPVATPDSGTGTGTGTGNGTGTATWDDYLAAAFSNWTPTLPKLVGKNQIAQELGLSRSTGTRHHLRLRGHASYRITGANQAWAIWDPMPSTRQAAIDLLK